MKIVVAGDWHSAVHEEPVYEALTSLGHEVVRFEWHRYFCAAPGSNRTVQALATVSGKAQNKYLVGPRFDALNRDLIRLAEQVGPELLFVYRGTHVTATTLQAIKAASPRTVLVGYNNDDPFGPGQPERLWRHFIAALPYYDLVLAYRHGNVEDFVRAGAKRARLLRSWFVPSRHHPLSLTPEDRARLGCDVVFVGHYERDGRLEMMETLARQGLQLRVYGPGRGFKGYAWDPVLERSSVLAHLAPVHLVWGDEYVKALCGAKIGLCFLSKLNRDTYTRRCFEIPATRTFMLCEFTEDLASMFAEGVEAEFFRSTNELVDKARFYASHEAARKAVAEAGYRRVVSDGHDVVSRMAQVVMWTRELLQ